MKKIILLFAIISLIGAIGCDDDGGNDGITTGIKVTASLAANTTFVHETDVEFTDFGATYPGDPGTGEIKILVWSASSLPANGQDGPTVGSITTDGGDTAIELTAGNYVVLAMYDFKGHGNGDAGKGDFYVFSDGASTPDTATEVVVTDGEVNEMSAITIDNLYQFKKDAAFDSK